MWKYCIIIEYLWVRDLREPYWTHKHRDYVEQRYFRTKVDAMKGYAQAVRDVKIFMSKQMRIIGSCHEGMVTERSNDKSYVDIMITNRFEKVYKDHICVKFLKLT